jgi:cyclohexadieny/prephenate dehydrogenase
MRVRAVVDADLVILAVPVGAVGRIAEQILPHMKSGAVLTDTGSTKRSVVRDVAPHVRDDVIWLPIASACRNRTFRAGCRI